MIRKRLIAAVMALVQASVIALGLFGAGFVSTASAAASCTTNGTTVDLSLQNGINCAAPPDTSNKTLFGSGGIFQTIAQTLIFIVGVVAVIMLIVGGLRYVLSAGDSKAVSAAKDTILYAVVGIVVALLSFALVNFVLGQLNKTTTTSGTGYVESTLDVA